MAARAWSLLGPALLGALTAVLGTAVHLWWEPVLGLSLPLGLTTALALAVATDVAVAAWTARAAALFAVAVGRAVVIGLVLFPTAEGDVVITGGPTSTTWVLLAVLLPSFSAPLLAAVTAVHAARAAQSDTAARASGSTRAQAVLR